MLDHSKVDMLVNSIMKVGVMEPIQILQAKGDRDVDKFYILAGHHRYLAVNKIRDLYPHLGEIVLPAYVTHGEVSDTNSKKFLIQSVVSNEAREESHIIDRAKGYSILRENGMSVQEICDAVGRSRRIVEKCLQVDKLPEEVKDFIVERHQEIKDTLVYQASAKFVRGENIGIDFFERIRSKPILTKPTSSRFTFSKEALKSALLKEKISMSKIERILEII